MCPYSRAAPSPRVTLPLAHDSGRGSEGIGKASGDACRSLRLVRSVLSRASWAGRVGLPIRPFLYTLDQVATLLDLEVKDMRDRLYLHGADTGLRPKDRMKAVNIGSIEHPDWRVAEHEFVRWLRYKGYRYYERWSQTDA